MQIWKPQEAGKQVLGNRVQLISKLYSEYVYLGLYKIPCSTKTEMYHGPYRGVPRVECSRIHVLCAVTVASCALCHLPTLETCTGIVRLGVMGRMCSCVQAANCSSSATVPSTVPTLTKYPCSVSR